MEHSINGIINVYKEAGFTSFDVVALLRGILKTKKIGHTGTLDPDAVGVLPVCIGSATKICDMLTDETKEYIAKLRLGVVTDTQDMSGTVLENHEDRLALLSEDRIREVIMSFVGESFQIPPMYSALKVNGQKLYDLARKGIEVERKPRKINIEEIEILGFEDDKLIGKDYEYGLHNIVNIRVVCSKGTYIRTLCNDIGDKLGCGGCMEHLLRSRVGDFRAENALKLSEIQKAADNSSLHNIIVPIDTVFSNYKAIKVTEAGMKALMNGNQLQINTIEDNTFLKARETYRVYSSLDKFCGLYEYHSGWNILKPVKMFLN